MTRTISLITATAGAALLFAVPAWGDSWGSDRQGGTAGASPDLVDLLTAKNGTIDNTAINGSNQANVAASPDWFERAAAVAIQKHELESMLNARERGLVNQAVRPVDARSEGMNRLYGLGEYSNPIDARERALVVPKTSPQPQGFDARSDGLNRLYGLGEYAPSVVADFDRFRIDRSYDPVTVSATSSGRDIEWPTVGIGFGIGLVLLLGITLAMKATHTRPFAH